jgi:hypothetical protein
LKNRDGEHAHRQETDFKLQARRNRLFGLWAAGELGLSGDEAASYAREVVLADLEEPGEEDMFRKVRADFERHGKQVTMRELSERLMDALHDAQKSAGAGG